MQRGPVPCNRQKSVVLFWLAVSRLIAAFPRFLGPASAPFAPTSGPVGITAIGITAFLGTRAQ